MTVEHGEENTFIDKFLLLSIIYQKLLKCMNKKTFSSFHMFPFHRNFIFSEISFKQELKKAESFCKCRFLRKFA